MMSFRSRVTSIFLLLCAILLAVNPSQAQATDVVIEIGEVVQGTFDPLTPPPRYLLSVDGPQPLLIDVLGLGEAVVPEFRVTDALGTPIEQVSNADRLAMLEATVNLPRAGLYAIEVVNATGQAGEFVLVAHPGTPLPAPISLLSGQLVADSVDPLTSHKRYTFGGEAQVMLLGVATGLTGFGPSLLLSDANSGATIAESSTQVLGARYRLPAGTTRYQLEVVHSGSSVIEPFEICLEPETGARGCLPLETPPATETAQPTPVPTLQPPSACTVSTTGGVSVNVRSGPGTGYSILSALLGSRSALVIGRSIDDTWWQINLDGLVGWISATYVTTAGDCSSVPPAVAPQMPTPLPPTAPPPVTTEPPPGITEVAPEEPTDTPTPTATFFFVPFEVIPFAEALAARPDLEIRRFNAYSHGPDVTRQARLSIVVRNNGASAAGPFTIAVQNAEGDTVASVPVTGLEPASIFTNELDVPLLGTGACFFYDCRLILVVDPANAVAEFDEDNNRDLVEFSAI